MSDESLEDRLRKADSPVQMLRTQPLGVFPFPIQDEFTNWRDEQRAWHDTAVVFDQSHHMTDVSFSGPDVRRLLSDTGVNSFKAFGKDRAKQFVACNYDGQVIADAILFGWEDDRVSLIGSPVAANWVSFNARAGDYDVEITRDEATPFNTEGRRIFHFQVQGASALEIIRKASAGTLPDIPFFRIGSFTIAGCAVRALNHTMIGVPGRQHTGLEITGRMDQGPAVLAALLEAGEEFGLQQGGAIAYPTTSVESGWIALPLPAIYTGAQMRPYREWLSSAGVEGTGSLGGSFLSEDVADYYVTPWDLGYQRVLKFDHDFIGREALERVSDQPHRQKVWLEWKDEDVMRVIKSSLFDGESRAKYLSLPNGVYATFQYDSVLAGNDVIGVSTWISYTVNLGHVYSLGMVDEAAAVHGREVTVVWGEPDGGSGRPPVERHVQTEIRARIHMRPPV